MGAFITKILERFHGLVDKKILLLGLDAAGKTTVMYKLKLGETVTTIPTVGFNVEGIETRNGVQMTMWDVGGQEKIRKLWRHYFQGTMLSFLSWIRRIRIVWMPLVKNCGRFWTTIISVLP